MKRLGVDSFDLFQLHAVGNIKVLDEVTAPDGALEALIEMKEQGLAKWVGITEDMVLKQPTLISRHYGDLILTR